MKILAVERLNKSFDQTFSKVWPPAGPPEASEILILIDVYGILFI